MSEPLGRDRLGRLIFLHIFADKLFDVTSLVRLRFKPIEKFHIRRKKSYCHRSCFLFLVFRSCTFLGFRHHDKLLSTEAMASGSGEPPLSVWLPLFKSSIGYSFRWMLTVSVRTIRQIRTRMLIASPFSSFKSLIAFDVINYNALHIIWQALYKNYFKNFYNAVIA